MVGVQWINHSYKLMWASAIFISDDFLSNKINHFLLEGCCVCTRGQWNLWKSQWLCISRRDRCFFRIVFGKRRGRQSRETNHFVWRLFGRADCSQYCFGTIRRSPQVGHVYELAFAATNYWAAAFAHQSHGLCLLWSCQARFANQCRTGWSICSDLFATISWLRYATKSICTRINWKGGICTKSTQHDKELYRAST